MRLDCSLNRYTTTQYLFVNAKERIRMTGVSKCLREGENRVYKYIRGIYSTV